VSAFGDILRELVERVPGAVGAVFADWDGEPVDQFAHVPPLDIQLVGAHWGVVWSQAAQRLGRHGIGAIFADWEGEMVDQFAHVPPLDIQLVGAHWGVVLNQIAAVTEHLGWGGVKELMIEAERGLALIRRVTDQYFVVLAAKKDVHLATALRELERGAAGLLGEM
jgi:predicted regulator of Ras-like GTPase activity (Roadblock/LC7/MglB family)